MAASSLNTLVLAVLVTAAGPAIGAARTAAAEPITLDAESLDGSTTSMLFRKVHIAQGSMSISADVGQGQGTKDSKELNFDNAVWSFRGNVKIDTTQGELAADDAQINFARRLLSKAIVNGKPALFEQRIEKTGKVVHGRADTIDFDAAKGVLQLSSNAWLSDGQTEMRGDSLKYDTVAQTLKSESTDPGSQRVHIIITPPAPSKP